MAPILLVVLSVAFRLPALVNAAGVNSDAAIVGLQAMHILRGEWSPLLFGSGYQTSVDSAVAALFFVLSGGPGPLPLMLSTLAGHILLTLLVFAMLRRHLGDAAALVAALPLVFTPPAVHTYVLHPPRQAALTLAMASFWALDRAATVRRPIAAYAFGASLASLACFADPYALVIAPGAVLFASLCALDRRPDRATLVRRLASCAVGFTLGAAPLAWLWRYPGAKHGPTGLTSSVLEHNVRLLVDTCLPWGLSYQAWVDRGERWEPWTAPPAVRVLQIVGALVFVVAVASGAVAFVRRSVFAESVAPTSSQASNAPAPDARVPPWEIRRIGLAGAATCALTVAGFLASVMVMDAFSTRYLAALVLASPLAVAPVVWRLRAARALALLAPYLASAALNGWLGFVPWTDGLRIARTDSGTARDELALARELRARGVAWAMADYWVSYRLTFIYGESIVVVPKNSVEDRYAPYAEGFERAPVVAYVFDPERSREEEASIADQLRARGVAFDRGEWLRAGRLVALVVRRHSGD